MDSPQEENSKPLSLTKHLRQKVRDCEELKKKILKRIETAKGDEVFKDILLVNILTCDSYDTQTQLQARDSFNVSICIAIAGFILIAVGVVLGMVGKSGTETDMPVAKLSAIAGLITEFISGIFFYLYHRALQQINMFREQLMTAQKLALGLFLSGLVDEAGQRNTNWTDISKALIPVIAAVQATQHNDSKT